MVDPWVGGVIGSVLMLIFLFMGVPIFICLGLSGAVGLILAEGFTGMTKAIANVSWAQVTSVGLLAIPVFILMGNLVRAHKFGEDLYGTTYKLLGRIPGSLAVVSTVVSALFGFMCGSGIAGTATIGGIAQPEMEKRGYDRRLALGTHAMGGCISAIVPPSILMIIYGVEAECSVGKLFFAGIIPGLVLTGLMCIYIIGRALINPALCPRPSEKPTRRDQLIGIAKISPLVFLFLTVLGGIYAGIWAPSEAGAAGSFFAVIIALAYRRVGLKSLKESIESAGKTAVMIYMLVIGANIYSLLCFDSGITDMLREWILGFNLPGWGIIIWILVILTILGTFLDVMAMLFIMLPISLPIVLDLGYDNVWFGVIMVLACELAQITPPVGLHLFIIQGIAEKGTKQWDVSMGALPYCFVIWALFLLLVAFPGIATWLPNTMMH